MRIAVFTDNDFDKVNGVTTTLTALLRFAPSGCSPRIYTASGEDRDDPGYFSLRSWGMGMPFYAGMRMYLPRLRRYARQARADGIQLIHLTTPGPVGLAAMYVAMKLDLPMVGSFHTDLAAYVRILSGSSTLGRLMSEYLRWPYGKCRRVLVPSLSVRESLIAAKFKADRLQVWPRGVDTEMFTPAKRSAELRASWRVDDDRPAIIYVGRVSKEKGLDLLPRLDRVLHDLGVPARFIIVGDGPYRSELRSRLSDAIFMGTLDREGVATALASADMKLFPSTTDTAGNVVLEAQASGLPVVVSSEGGPSEYLQHDVTGYVCRGQDLGDFATRTVELLRMRDRRRRLGLAGRQSALRRTWPSALEPVFAAYRDALVGAQAVAPLAFVPLASRDGRS